MGFLYAFGAAILWGLIYAIDQKILVDVSLITLMFFNSAVTAAILLPLMFFDNRLAKFSTIAGTATIPLILITLILTIFANFLTYSSIVRLDASTSSMIVIAYPFFVVLFAYLFYRSTPGIYFFIGGALIFVGSAIIVRFS